MNNNDNLNNNDESNFWYKNLVKSNLTPSHLIGYDEV